MAAQLAALAPAAVLGAGGRGPALVAVPCHPARRRARGYDQAVLLARALAQRTGRELAAPLRRGGRAGDRQAGSSRATRLGAGRVTFTVRGRAPGAVVLVDDVHTTGATLHAAASALRAAGTERVTALTWARTLDDG
jgi:predicted amidophosphoribosyltransferase